MATLFSPSTRPFFSSIAEEIRGIESVAFWMLQSGDAAEEAGNAQEAEAFYAQSDKLFAKVETIKAGLL